MITSLNTENALFYQGSYTSSGRPIPTYIDIYDYDGQWEYRLNVSYLVRMRSDQLTTDDPSILIQGDSHGIDNDVEHVAVEGCVEDYYSVTNSTSPVRFTAKPFALHKYRGNNVLFPDHDLHCGCFELSGFTCKHIYNDVYWCHFAHMRIYDTDVVYRSQPMYDEWTFNDWTSLSFPHPSGAKGTCTLNIGVSSTLRHCYFDGTLQREPTEYNLTQEFTMYSKAWDGNARQYVYTDCGFSTIPLGVHKELLNLKDACYYDALRLLPQLHASARCRAFEEAVEGIDKLDTNNLANAKQLLDAFKKLIKLDVKGALAIPSTLKDWWLWYRYSYTTTKMDVDEFVEYFSDFNRKFHKQRFTVYSSFEDPREDTVVGWTCGVTLHKQLSDMVEQIADIVQKLGLYPGLVNLWDMVPYSFVVDWFIPLGDIFQQLETFLQVNTEVYVFERINYSVQCSLESRAYVGLRYRYYRRWSEDGPPPVRFWIGEGTYEPSTQTTLKRITDGVCLFLTGG